MIVAMPAPIGPDISDPRIPAHRDVITRDLIDRFAEEKPDQPFAIFDDNGEIWTYAEFRKMVLQTALGLQQQGVAMGDHVLLWMPNTREHIRIYFALNYLGAVYVPINTAYRGNLLEHVIALSDAKLAIVHSSLCPRLSEVSTALLEKVILCGDDTKLSLPVVRYEDVLLPQSGTLAPPARRIEPWDPMSIIFTSGTTGPSKAVLSSYLHMHSNCGPDTWTMVGSEDRFMVMGPMFHITGMGPMYTMLERGASFALVDRFDTTTFWDSVRSTGCTVVFLLGVMATFLEKQPERPDDADNPLRLAFIVPVPKELERFSRRFKIDTITIFNMSEISTPLLSDINPTLPGTCGRVRPGVEVRLVDENDCEVPVGEKGELLVRTDCPWAMFSSYYKNDEATAKAWRNGWYHTGDVFRRDEAGNFYFLDRAKDTIRRRGENISSQEVEIELLKHPAVREAAAIAVPAEGGEDEVMACLSSMPGQEIDHVELIEFLRERLAYFMVPRYIRLFDDLPKTPSSKVLKADLRKEGITQDTWDREQAGIRIKAERFEKAGS